MDSGCAGQPMNLDSAAAATTTPDSRVCCDGLDEQQLRMLKALVRHRAPDFHEIIDRAVASFDE